MHGFAASGVDPLVLDVVTDLYENGRSGLGVLTYDARGHGESDGLCTLGDLERHDVAAAVATAREHCGVVVVVGASMGAIAVLRYAATDPDLAGVVLVSSPAKWDLPRSLRGIAAAALTQTPVGRAVARRWMNTRLASGWSSPEAPVELVPRVRAPLAVLHGESDRMIASAAAQQLHDAAAEPRRLVLIPGGGHAYAAGASPAIREAVEWTLTVSGITPAR